MTNVKNNLKTFIIQERASAEALDGKKRNLGDIKRDIAEQCGVTYHNIEQIYRGSGSPSLLLAIKIAKYFNVKVEDIFYIEG
ncbi:XRE family transcriptional regulator [Bacillus phage 278BB001]|nr:XRE family transcriptional regulator [Bacillus phage 010DV004]QZA69259.1 XRE family transcriptional regulator [Bacillus phage 010DV005]QZA70185.1 XRE family transcriptional regulator [Bacillus phage 278BB001]